jgi:hypothetical protein
MYRVAAHIMAKRSDSMNNITLDIPLEPIEKYIRHALHAIEAQEEALALPFARYKECALVVCHSLTIGAITDKSLGIPSVRQAYLTRIVT